MMRSVSPRRRSGFLGSLSHFVRIGVASGVCNSSCFRFDHEISHPAKFSRTPSQGNHMLVRISSHKQLMLLFSRSIPLPRDGAKNAFAIACLLYSGSYAPAAVLGLARCLCTSLPSAPQDTAESKPEGGFTDKGNEEWQPLSSLMAVLKDGLAEGKALEALKGLVDRLQLSVEPSDPRLALACLRLARSLEAAGEEPSKCLPYAKRALMGFETLDGSWDHVTCLDTMGMLYLDLGNVDDAVSMFERGVFVTEQIKGSMHNEHRNKSLLLLQQVLGQLESYRGNYRKSIGHFERAISLGKKMFKPESPKLSAIYYKAAGACRNVRDHEAAMSLSQKALDGFMTCYGPSSLQVGKVRALMAGIHCDLKMYDEAFSDYHEAKPILEYLKHTLEIAKMNLDIADLLMYENKYAAALPYFQETIKITKVTSLFHFLALVRAGLTSSKLKLEIGPDYCQKAVYALDHHEVHCHNAYDLVQLGLIMKKRGDTMCAAVILEKVMKWVDRFSSLPYAVQSKGRTVQFESNDKLAMYRFCEKVGKMLLRAGMIQQAAYYYERCLKDTESGNGIQLFYVHCCLGVCYVGLNQGIEAAKHERFCIEFLTELILLRWKYLYYLFLTKNRSIDNLGALESMSICILRWFL